jgi:hypothetical protein
MTEWRREDREMRELKEVWVVACDEAPAQKPSPMVNLSYL